MGVKVKIHPAFFMYCLVFAPGMFHIFVFSRVLKSDIYVCIYIYLFFFNADTTAHTCFQVCQRDAEVDGGCRRVKHLWKSFSSYSCWSCRVGLTIRACIREGQGLLFLAAGKCTGRDGAVICSGVLTGADDLLFKTVGEVKWVFQS